MYTAKKEPARLAAMGAAFGNIELINTNQTLLSQNKGGNRRQSYHFDPLPKIPRAKFYQMELMVRILKG